MLKCREVTERAGDWLDGELSAGQRLKVTLHLFTCRHCRSLVDGLDTTRRLIEHHVAPDYPLPEHLQQRINEAIDGRVEGGADTSPCRPNSFDASGNACNDAVFTPLQEPSDERVKRIFDEIRAQEGYVPNLFRAYGHSPELLEQAWDRVKSLMYGGRLSAELKNAIAVIVSRDNGCDYCVAHHKRALKRLGVKPDEVASFLTTSDPVFLSAYDQTLLQLARTANRNPHGSLTGLLDNTRVAGADNSDILEAMGVMELYTSFNRTIDSLDIPLEDDLAGEL